MKDIWFVYLFLAAFPALIIFAAVYKYIEVMQASYWSSTPGRIVISTAEAREVKAGVNTTDTERRNFARIEYVYDVAGRQYRGHRVSIGENLGNFEVADTVARYPVGKTVIVYYNPNNRAQSVLERDAPAGVWKVVTIMVLVMAALIVGAVAGFSKITEIAARLISNPGEAPFLTACLAMAFVASLIVYAVQKDAARKRAWPTAPGKIESAGVRQFQELDTDKGRSRWRTRYRTDIAFSYEAGGVRYTGDKIGTGMFSASTDAFARRAAARYRPGDAVLVHYNPENPAEAMLAPGGTWLILLWAIPVALVVLAVLVDRW